MNDHALILPSVDISALAAHLGRGGLLLTATPQQAGDWKRRLISASDHAVCETPAVLTWQAWLRELAAGQASMPVALNRIQEHWLWEQVIRADFKQSGEPGQSAASVRGLAGHARHAYALMQEYRIDKAELACAGAEADALLRWIDAVHNKLNGGALAGRMLDADAALKLLSCIEATDKPAAVLLAGFDVFTPMQQALLTALQALGVELAQVTNEAMPAESTLCICNDTQSEYRHIASRIRSMLDDAPALRIIIATADAAHDMTALKRRLNDALMPELRYEPVHAMQAVVMAGESLADRPMIRQLLHMLTLSGEFSLSFDEFSTLLFSPWLKGYEAERFERAELDARFRQRNRHRLTFQGLLNTAEVQAMPELLSVIRAMADWDRHKRSANDWVKAVHELLKTTGFVRLGAGQNGADTGGQRNNHDIRQMNAFRDVLTSLVAVDALAEDSSRGQLTWMQFLGLLRTGCSECHFPEMAKYANVMVLPLSQISALQCDHLFVMGMDEEAFPAPARPCPLLPASVQKKYALPMSSGAQVYASARRLWDTVLQSAPRIDISCVRQRDDRELLPSSFVADVEAQPCDILDEGRLRLPMERFDDIAPVPLSPGATVRGGTSILRNQSACPFRAFAMHRLGIAPLGETSPGIEPSSKGSLIHLALEYIWRRLQRQSALAALSDADTAALIDAAISHAWSEAYVAVDSRTRDCEKQRMQSVLRAWLALELQRPAFRVTAIEKSFQLRLPASSAMPGDVDADRSVHIDVKITADRMDMDASGRQLLIDYKTGARQSTAKWLNERIEEPQLPQYALAAELGVDDAVAFARVRSGDMAYEGLCGDDIGIQGIIACDGKRGAPDDWQAVLDDWRTNINALATEFVEGRCDVSPRDAHACQYCGLEAVCRVEETGNLEGKT